MWDDDSLIAQVQRAYERLERNDALNVSRYNSTAMSDPLLFGLICVYVTATDSTQRTSAWDDVVRYATNTYSYQVCERCDSDICAHVNN